MTPDCSADLNFLTGPSPVRHYAGRVASPTVDQAPSADLVRSTRKQLRAAGQPGRLGKWRRSLLGAGGLRILAAAAGGYALNLSFAPSTQWWLAMVGLALLGPGRARPPDEPRAGTRADLRSHLLHPAAELDNGLRRPGRHGAGGRRGPAAHAGRRADRGGHPKAAALADLGRRDLDRRRGIAGQIPVRRLPLGWHRLLAAGRAAAAVGFAARRVRAGFPHCAGRIRPGRRCPHRLDQSALPSARAAHRAGPADRGSVRRRVRRAGRPNSPARARRRRSLRWSRATCPNPASSSMPAGVR